MTGPLWFRKSKSCFTSMRITEGPKVMYIRIHCKFLYYLPISQKKTVWHKILFSLNNSQRCHTTLHIACRQLCMNIPVNTRKCFGIAHFWTSLYTWRFRPLLDHPIYVTLCLAVWPVRTKILTSFNASPPAQIQISSKPVKSFLRQNMWTDTLSPLWAHLCPPSEERMHKHVY